MTTNDPRNGRRLFALNPLLLVAALFGFAVAGGVAFAIVGIPDADGVIHGCYIDHTNPSENQGNVRLVTGPDKCRSNEVAIAWNQTGPAGPPGPPGTGVDPSAMELKGPVTGLTSGTTGTENTLLSIIFPVGLAIGEDPIDLTPGTTSVEYSDPSQSITMTITGSPYGAFIPAGYIPVPTTNADKDFVLEDGETSEIRIINLDALLDPDLSEGTTFTIDVISRFGSVLQFERTTPDFPPVQSVIVLPE